MDEKVQEKWSEKNERIISSTSSAQSNYNQICMFLGRSF